MTIKEARLRAGLTQKAMSELLEIPKRTIEAWEGGVNTPPPYVEKLIVEKLLSLELSDEEKEKLHPRRK